MKLLFLLCAALVGVTAQAQVISGTSISVTTNMVLQGRSTNFFAVNTNQLGAVTLLSQYGVAYNAQLLDTTAMEIVNADQITSDAFITGYDGVIAPNNYAAPIGLLNARSTAIECYLTNILALTVLPTVESGGDTNGIPRDALVLEGDWAGIWRYDPFSLSDTNGANIRYPDSTTTNTTQGRWELVTSTKTPKTVPTMAELLSTDPRELATLFAGTNEPVAHVFVQGYYAPGDGGEQTLIYTNSITGTNLYGGKFLALGGTGSWQDTDLTIVNIRKFGAVSGASITSNSWSGTGGGTITGTDSTLRIQSAIDFAASLNLAVTGKGSFLISSNGTFTDATYGTRPYCLTLTNSATLFGHGRDLQFVMDQQLGDNGNPNGIVMQGTNITVRGIKVLSNRNDTYNTTHHFSGYGVVSAGGAGHLIEDCEFQQCIGGARIVNGYQSSIRNSFSWNEGLIDANQHFGIVGSTLCEIVECESNGPCDDGDVFLFGSGYRNAILGCKVVNPRRFDRTGALLANTRVPPTQDTNYPFANDNAQGIGVDSAQREARILNNWIEGFDIGIDTKTASFMPLVANNVVARCNYGIVARYGEGELAPTGGSFIGNVIFVNGGAPRLVPNQWGIGSYETIRYGFVVQGDKWQGTMKFSGNVVTADPDQFFGLTPWSYDTNQFRTMSLWTTAAVTKNGTVLTPSTDYNFVGPTLQLSALVTTNDILTLRNDINNGVVDYYIGFGIDSDGLPDSIAQQGELHITGNTFQMYAQSPSGTTYLNRGGGIRAIGSSSTPRTMLTIKDNIFQCYDNNPVYFPAIDVRNWIDPIIDGNRIFRWGSGTVSTTDRLSGIGNVSVTGGIATFDYDMDWVLLDGDEILIGSTYYPVTYSLYGGRYTRTVTGPDVASSAFTIPWQSPGTVEATASSSGISLLTFSQNVDDYLVTGNTISVPVGGETFRILGGNGTSWIALPVDGSNVALTNDWIVRRYSAPPIWVENCESARINNNYINHSLGGVVGSNCGYIQAQGNHFTDGQGVFPYFLFANNSMFSLTQNILTSAGASQNSESRFFNSYATTGVTTSFRSALNDLFFSDADFNVGNYWTVAGAGTHIGYTNTVQDVVGSSFRPNSETTIHTDRGDANYTITYQSPRIIPYDSALTANRTVSITTNSMSIGTVYRVVRTSASGAFTLDVVGLRTIPASTAGWVEFMYNGGSVKLTSFYP